MGWPSHKRVVIAGGWRGYRLPRDRPFTRWYGVRERERARRQASCPHPPERIYGGDSHDGVMWYGCCLCGAMLYDSAIGNYPNNRTRRGRAS